jgi:hypothetical protein
MADTGTLRPTDMVFQEGTQQWVAAHSVPSLMPVLEAIVDEEPERPRAIVAQPEAGRRRSQPEPEPAPRRGAHAPRGDGEALAVGKCPTTVVTAGIVWIVVGSFILLNLLAILVAMFAVSDERGAEGRAVGGVVISLFLGFVGGVFIHVGVQSIRGTAKDTLGNGIGSLIFGVLEMIAAFTQEGRFGKGVQIATALLFAVGLYVAGILALVGRENYRAWRRRRREMLEREEEERYQEEEERYRRRR